LHDRRKLEQLQICLNQDIQSSATTGLEKYRLVHQALPGIALHQVDTHRQFLGHDLAAPLLLSSMTGGTPLAEAVNRRLAVAAQALGLAMGLGSQRAAIEDPALLSTYRVRAEAPDILLFANLGAVQLNYGFGLEECRRAVESVGADALILHLNPLQEALQPEGNTDFSGLVERIAAICAGLDVPVIVKEVGYGLSREAAAALSAAGVSALDVAGAGGTSWSEVERHRSASTTESEVAQAFRGWGLPTAEALLQVRAACPELSVIASGGITDGVQVAIALALGADLAGLAHALLHPAMESAAAIVARLQVILRQLRVAMFCTGARTLTELNGAHLAPSPQVEERK
jgi:isopentenyl-diphosphate Delta-isomerase